MTPLTDSLGSVVSLTDASGTIQTSYSYEPFGKTSATGTASGNRQKYTGREDDGTGLYYLRNRYYSPSWQRFISEDPIGLRGGDINVYAYGRNNPIKYCDPWGLEVMSADQYLAAAQSSGGRKESTMRWIYTGDPDAPDDVYNAARAASYNDLQENSPIRGVFVFVGGDANVQGGEAEGLLLGGYNLDEGLYGATLAAGSKNGRYSGMGMEVFYNADGRVHATPVVLMDSGVIFKGRYGAGGFWEPLGNSAGYYGYYGRHEAFVGGGVEVDFSKVKNIASWWWNAIRGKW